MKNLIIAAMLFVPTIAFSEEQPASKEIVCNSLGALAKVVMENRQMGVPLSKMLEVPAKMQEESLANITTAIILEAYDSPKFSGKQYQQEAAEEFSNKVVLECWKNL